MRTSMVWKINCNIIFMILGLKNVHKKRKLQGNLLIKLKNDYFKLKHTSYIQYNIREDIYSITPL
ncbi:hypothetical protein PFAG_04618 [Plasmodium falciparum Santa Lucia]|uniref:Uncharacterized protein n=3 Tax=Plasmodium falciparum TaxID=5833 RepID=W7F7I6_PLAF8|nr:hypothetical protein PFNF135_04788 [Plasmodium falciparum NF135/5.C10]EUR66365.1 hypothetical protein PFBG_04652 [Plasmodium falciparum 7G8]EUT81405.1 hypothetical protein PFAG_04618 [Plasmodium falciparum Santa Lucia]